MRLFHGTSTEHLDRILTEGIQPRSVTGRTSNWGHDVPTRTDYVWLTAAYAVYYAVEAADEGHDPVIVEVDFDKLPDLYPDEDFIANQRDTGTKEDWQAERAGIDPKHHKALWRQSLHVSGNVCVRHVPVEAVIDHRMIPKEGNSLLLLNTGYDAVPHDSNYPYCGRFYRRCMEAYFEHELSDMPEVVSRLNDEQHRELLGEEGFREMQELMVKHGTPRKSS